MPPLRRGPVSRLVAELLGVCVALADDAGDIVRVVAEGGHMGAVKDKSGDGADKKDGVDARDERRVPARRSARNRQPGLERKTTAREGFALDPQTQADRRSERLICDTLRRAFGGVVAVVGEEASEGALAAKGAANADGSVDEDDAALEMSDETLARAADFVRDWELLLPPELEVGPAAEARLVKAAEELAEEKGLSAKKAAGDLSAEGDLSETKPALFSHPACAESDVTVWVDPLDGTREFVEGPEHWGSVTVLIGVAVKGVPVAGVIHQPFVGIDGKPPASMTALARAPRRGGARRRGLETQAQKQNPEDDLETFPTGSFGKGRTLWGVPGLGVFSNPGREPHRAMPVMKPKPADFKNLRVATTRSHPSPFVEGAVYKLYPSVVHRAGARGEGGDDAGRPGGHVGVPGEGHEALGHVRGRGAALREPGRVARARIERRRLRVRRRNRGVAGERGRRHRRRGQRAVPVDGTQVALAQLRGGSGWGPRDAGLE